MKNIALAVLVALMGIVALAPAAEARGGVSVGIGVGGGYYPYYSPYYYGYPGYYAPTYYAPAPTVVYQQAPAPVTYVQPQPQAPQALPSTPASATFTDAQGRTCRQFQSTIDGAPVNGTACLQSDGSWHTVD